MWNTLLIAERLKLESLIPAEVKGIFLFRKIVV
jgi:hypothetical protein